MFSPGSDWEANNEKIDGEVPSTVPGTYEALHKIYLVFPSFSPDFVGWQTPQPHPFRIQSEGTEPGLEDQVVFPACPRALMHRSPVPFHTLAGRFLWVACRGSYLVWVGVAGAVPAEAPAGLSRGIWLV